MSLINKQLAEILKNARKRSRLTQLQVAKAFGYDSQQFISMVELRRSKPPYNVLAVMFKLYKMTKAEQKQVRQLLIDDFISKLDKGLTSGTP